MSKSLFLLMALAVGPAFAADGGVASRVISGNLGENTTSADVIARTASRATANRVVSANTGRGVVVDGAARATTSRATTNNATASRATTTRANASSRGMATRAATNATGAVKTRASGDINENPAVRRAGVVLRPSFADFGGRATISGTGKQTGSNIDSDIQKVVGRATKKTPITKESIAEAKEKLEQTAELNKSCQEQYNECMDQFCAVVDSNQKRCSCSSNLSRYTKVEKAVTEANTKLNEVAQAIRYVGLSADEIRAIMTETEAEEALSGTKDTSTTRNMLKQIESMIKDPTSTNTYVAETNFGLDMDLTFSSEPLDIFNLDFLNLGTNNSTISNLRGTELYNTAKRRCNTILTQCKEVGATQEQITGNYDLAIDKDCIAYEAGLKKMNETLLSNVKSANLMLQKARLAVLQNKNQFDARACVSALDTCMRDDMVCGDDYYKCVDPTKAYIDENGEVVLGQDITVIQSFMTEYNNAAIDSAFLQSAYSDTQIGKNTCAGDGKCVVKYLMQKIGTKQKSTDEGLCRPVLDKCQYYTYKDDKYQPYNDIVLNYVQRAMVNVKAAQQKIISDYASTCIADVAACYNSQITQVNSWASSASAANIYSVMRGACRSVALTCGFALFTGEPIIEEYQPLTVDGKTYHVDDCPAAAAQQYGTAAYNDGLINCVSDMFYQSLLCPDNSTFDFDGGTHTIATNGTTGNGAWVNTKCRCNAGYEVWSDKCLASCGDDQTRGTSGSCVCRDPTKTLKNGVCVASTSTADNGETPQPGTYTVTYKCNGGSGSIEPTTCESGKTFYPDDVKNCGTKNNTNPTIWDKSSATCNGALTFTAQWPGETPTTTYTVSYSCGEGNGEPPTNQSVQSGQQVTLQQNTCTAPDSDHVFKEWLCNNVSQAHRASITVNANIECTAQWKEKTNNTVTVQYNCGDGSGTPPAADTFENCMVLPTTPDSCSKTGQAFSGWKCNNDRMRTYICNGDYSDSEVNCVAQYGSTVTAQSAQQLVSVSNKKVQSLQQQVGFFTTNYLMTRTADEICLLYTVNSDETVNSTPVTMVTCGVDTENM